MDDEIHSIGELFFSIISSIGELILIIISHFAGFFPADKKAEPEIRPEDIKKL